MRECLEASVRIIKRAGELVVSYSIGLHVGESGFAYGYRNITKDLKDHGEQCGKNRVYRIMREAGIRSQRDYKRHKGFSGGHLSHVAPNTLDRKFEVAKPNKAWVTDFTHIRTHEGWLYLTVVIDLFSRQVIGWSMKSNPKAD